MRCRYCYIAHKPETMCKEVALSAIDMALQSDQKYPGVAFFGGEPLLCKDLIKEMVEYAKKQEPNRKLMYKLATNGLLLDDQFLLFARENGIYIALSMDGIKEAHDLHRIERNGIGTYQRVYEKAKKLLSVFPSAPVMVTINPDTAVYFSASIKHLYEIGFRYFICAINYLGEWDYDTLDILKAEYKILSNFYYDLTLSEEDFYFSPFESKVNSHINKNNYCGERCQLATHQVSVGYDGSIYPCIQFTRNPNTAIGNVFAGIDHNKRNEFTKQNDSEKKGCDRCAIRSRCNHYCACVNLRSTGDANQVSPILCAHERMVLSIADKLAVKLYRKKSSMFIQKHYNEYYPLISSPQILRKLL